MACPCFYHYFSKKPKTSLRVGPGPEVGVCIQEAVVSLIITGPGVHLARSSLQPLARVDQLAHAGQVTRCPSMRLDTTGLPSQNQPAWLSTWLLLSQDST